MKLYYDMFIPYMPDSVKNEAGELVVDNIKKAGREAMMELSNFQATGNIMALYQSVLNACIYAEADLVDVLLEIPNEDDIPDGTTINALLDESASMLFKSIRPNEKFEINKFASNLLNVAHAILEENRRKEDRLQVQEGSEELSETPQENTASDASNTQMTIDDFIS